MCCVLPGNKATFRDKKSMEKRKFWGQKPVWNFKKEWGKIQEGFGA